MTKKQPKKRRRGFFGRKKRAASATPLDGDAEFLNDEETDVLGAPGGSARGRSKSEGKKKKEKRGWSFFGGGKKKKNKRNKRAASENPAGEINDDDLLDVDNNDLIDQLYNNSPAALPSPSSPSSGPNFATYTAVNKEGDNNLNMNKSNNRPRLTPSPREKLHKSVSFKDHKQSVSRQNEAEAARNSNGKGIRQSIRNLLTGSPDKPDATTEEEQKRKTEEHQNNLSKNFATNADPDPDVPLSVRTADGDEILLDSSKILSNQYEEESEPEILAPAPVAPIVEEAPPEPVQEEPKPEEKEETPEPAKSEATVVIKEPPAELAVDTEEEKENLKGSKLYDFLNSLDNDEEDEDDASLAIEEKVEEAAPPPPPAPKEEESKKKTVKKKVRVKKKLLKKQLSESDDERKVPSKKKNGEENDIEKILKTLSFNQTSGEQSGQQLTSKEDMSKIKADLKREIEEDLKRERNDGMFEKLMEEQRDLKRLLDEERQKKEDITQDLRNLKADIEKREADAEQRRSKSEKKKEKEEKTMLETLLKENEKQMKKMEELLSKKQEQIFVTQSQSNVDKNDEKRRQEDEKALKTMEAYTEQMKLERNSILEEEERKQAFQIEEKRRLQELRDHGIMPIDLNSDFKAFNSSFQMYSEPSADEESLSFAYFLRLLEDKYFSPHFEEGVWFLLQTCTILILFAVFSKSFGLENIFAAQTVSEGELGSVPTMKKFSVSTGSIASILTAQLFHSSYSQLVANVVSLVKVSLGFLVTDKQPLNIRELFLSSFLVNAVVGAFARTVLLSSETKLCGSAGIVYGMFFHVLCRGVFSSRPLDRMVTAIYGAFALQHFLFGGALSVASSGEWPFLVGGAMSGCVTAMLSVSSSSQKFSCSAGSWRLRLGI